MQRPEVVLGVLNDKSKKDGYVFKDLYRNLFNPDFYVKAYTKIAPNQGNMTPGTDNETLDGFGNERINKLIERIKNESYQPKPARREYIPKRNSNKKRPLGIPSTDDKIVQEIVRAILEAIYEVSFSDYSHGFRPNRSCHTCLMQIKDTCKSTKWWIEGDIKGFFDNIDHEILIGVLRKRIKDERFLSLIRKFLNAGYVEDWTYHRTYSGTPQGGILSPILANIFLNEFDEFMKGLIEDFNTGTGRTHNNKYMNKTNMVRQRRKKRKLSNDETRKETLLKEIKQLEKEYRQMPSKDPMDKSFKRLKYFRYADDFIVSVIGDKEDAEYIKEKAKKYLADTMKLELNDEKTLITHNSKSARFLGYEIKINQSQDTLDTVKGKVRQLSGNVLLALPHDRIRDFMLKNRFMKIMKDGTWKAIHNPLYINGSDLEIIKTYNSQIRGFYNYYNLANNIHSFKNPFFLIHQSIQKTLANKYKTSTAEVRKRYMMDGKLHVNYKNKHNETKTVSLFNGPFSRTKKLVFDKNIDIPPAWHKYHGRTQLEDRLRANQCEWCGNKDGNMEVHHVKKIKDLKGKKMWEKMMIARQRKTMVLCKKCHVDLHAGQLD
ncbi:reverse transcriptase domain-containing protein [Cytobacillus sp. Bac17]|uniref:reverse transcriptase domain-containing protein n=1 Tax=Cytobacillus sp. Bac17 TaxID=2926008 RepID=UPI002118CC44|nr:reverse transcriptase domain-containing protein [Cytobacillus sp. Bac17]